MDDMLEKRRLPIRFKDELGMVTTEKYEQQMTFLLTAFSIALSIFFFILVTPAEFIGIEGYHIIEKGLFIFGVAILTIIFWFSEIVDFLDYIKFEIKWFINEHKDAFVKIAVGFIMASMIFSIGLMYFGTVMGNGIMVISGVAIGLPLAIIILWVGREKKEDKPLLY